MKLKSWIALGVTLLVSSSNSPARAGGEAKLSHSQGDVEFTPDSGKARTGKNSQAVLEWNGSKIKLKPNTEIVIETSADGPVVNLARGGVLCDVVKQNAGKKFRVRTQSVLMGVRGTRFFASSSSKGDVWMCVKEGSVEVTAQGKTEEVPAGQGVRISLGSPPSAPKAYEWTRDINWNFDATHGAIGDKIDPENLYPDLRRMNYD